MIAGNPGGGKAESKNACGLCADPLQCRPMWYSLIKPILFRIDPEWIHHRVLSVLAWCSRSPAILDTMQAACTFSDPTLAVRCFGLDFPHPILLAAGLDKNAVAIPAWAALGFAGVEIGSITALAQPGNPVPRLFRLPADRALINRMGFNNDGAEQVAARLAALFEQRGRPSIPLGINLGKSKVTPLEQAPEDYQRSMSLLWPFADYFVINVSSPNTPGLRQLQERDKLEQLLDVVQTYGLKRAAPGHSKPLLLKIAPDLTSEQVDELADLALARGLEGLIATNTTLSREGLKTPLEQAGGLSGQPLKKRAREVLVQLRARVGTRLPLVSVGGIDSGEEVLERLKAGASLVQVYTGFIYEGPALISRSCRTLQAAVKQAGQPSLAALLSQGGVI